MLAAARIAWLLWSNRGTLAKGVMVVAGVVVGVPLALTVAIVAALSGPIQSAQAIGGAARPMESWVLSQPFGCTGFFLEPARGACAHFHEGIDLVAPAGTPVHAVMAGVVEVSPLGGYGLHVLVHHGGDLVTLYGHLSGFAVAGGTAVTAGTVIGAEGSTGASTGAHLHFEVRRAGQPVDPTQVFPTLFAVGGQPASMVGGTGPAAQA
jgi:murein DD-endopeptidase MepM/ murein hydrolase activator NlpD